MTQKMNTYKLAQEYKLQSEKNIANKTNLNLLNLYARSSCFNPHTCYAKIKPISIFTSLLFPKFCLQCHPLQWSYSTFKKIRVCSVKPLPVTSPHVLLCSLLSLVREKSHAILDWSHGTTAFLVFRVSAESSLFSRFSAAGTTEVIPNQSHAVATNKPTNFPYQGITFAPADPLTVESLRAPPSRGAIKQGPVKQTNN